MSAKYYGKAIKLRTGLGCQGAWRKWFVILNRVVREAHWARDIQTDSKEIKEQPGSYPGRVFHVEQTQAPGSWEGGAGWACRRAGMDRDGETAGNKNQRNKIMWGGDSLMSWRTSKYFWHFEMGSPWRVWRKVVWSDWYLNRTVWLMGCGARGVHWLGHWRDPATDDVARGHSGSWEEMRRHSDFGYILKVHPNADVFYVENNNNKKRSRVCLQGYSGLSCHSLQL